MDRNKNPPSDNSAAILFLGLIFVVTVTTVILVLRFERGDNSQVLSDSSHTPHPPKTLDIFTEIVDNTTIYRLASIPSTWRRVLLLSNTTTLEVLYNMKVETASVTIGPPTDIQIRTTTDVLIWITQEAQDSPILVNVTFPSVDDSPGRRLLASDSVLLLFPPGDPFPVAISYWPHNRSDYFIGVRFSEGTRFFNRSDCEASCINGTTTCREVMMDMIFPHLNPTTFYECHYTDELMACQAECPVACDLESLICDVNATRNYTFGTECVLYLNGELHCHCEAGRRDDPMYGCVDVNECLLGTHTCVTHCVNTDGSFQCTPCEGSFQGDGTECFDVDECAAGMDDCFAECINTIGSFLCTCPDGYTGDGINCTDIDECASEHNPCFDYGYLNGTDCYNTIGSFECVVCRYPALEQIASTFWDTFLDPRCPRRYAFIAPVDNARLGGLEGADALCREQAAESLLQGTFRAWLSTSEFPQGGDRLLPLLQDTDNASVPYALPDGRLLAFNFSSFFITKQVQAGSSTVVGVGGTLETFSGFNELANGTAMTSRPWDGTSADVHVAYTGLDPLGIVPEPRPLGFTCGGWTSDSDEMFAVGGLVDSWFLFAQGYPWAWTRMLYLSCGSGTVKLLSSAYNAAQFHFYIYCVSISDECDGDGFDLTDGQCVDRNECANNNNTASLTCLEHNATCINEPGAFTCDCATETEQFDPELEECVVFDPCVERHDSCPYLAQCFSNGTCGSCFPGTTGADCHDIHECATHCQTSDGYICTELVGNYSCDACFYPALVASGGNGVSRIAKSCPYLRAFLLPIPYATLIDPWTYFENLCEDAARENRLIRKYPFLPLLTSVDAGTFVDQQGSTPDYPIVGPDGTLFLRGVADLRVDGAGFIKSFDILANGSSATAVTGNSTLFLVLTSMNAIGTNASFLDVPVVSQLFSEEGNCTDWSATTPFWGQNGVAGGIANPWIWPSLSVSGPSEPNPYWDGPISFPCAKDFVQTSVEWAIYCIEQKPPLGGEADFEPWQEVFLPNTLVVDGGGDGGGGGPV